MNKIEARKIARKTLSNLTTEEKLKREVEIINLLKNNKRFLKAKKVGIYYPLKNEINLLSLKELFPNKKYYFPKTFKEEMDFRRVNNLKELKPAKFDLKEPTEKALIESEIDVYLVPCMATYKNYRLGHGAGYYDRYFSKNKGYKIGIVYSKLKDVIIEIDTHDIPMDEIL